MSTAEGVAADEVVEPAIAVQDGRVEGGLGVESPPDGSLEEPSGRANGVAEDGCVKGVAESARVDDRVALRILGVELDGSTCEAMSANGFRARDLEEVYLRDNGERTK